ncbi:MAG: hypothetical protein OSJ22_03425 [Rikenellaceae bacterium]|nr:hypothetical protein [Rikenellaceae bacterium]
MIGFVKRAVTLTAATMLFSVVSLSAAVKVVERSSKKAPVWLNTMETEYIITSAVADDLERAKALCMDNIRTQVIESVAQNVQSSSASTLSQETMTSGITDFVDNFSSTFKTQAATVPFLTGISASKAEDYYWEKRQDKDTGEITWLYSIKYPFPRIELKRLVDIFDTNDRKMVARYEQLRAEYDDIESVEQIDKAVSDLKPLIDYFFDDVRKGDALTLQRNYSALYGRIFLSEVSSRPGEYVYRLMLGDNPVSISRKPSLKSETLTQLHAEKRGTEWVVTYDYSDAEVNEQNVIRLSQRIGPLSIREEIFADLAGTVIEIKPVGEVSMSAEVRTDSVVSGITMRMDANTNHNDLKIKGVTLRVPGIMMPVIADGLDIALTGRGVDTVTLTLPGPYEIDTAKDNTRINILRGSITVSDGEGVMHKVSISVPAACNW